MWGYKVRKRDDVEPMCPMKHCLCFDLRMGTFLSAMTTFILSLFAWLLVILDLASWIDPDFQIQGSYYTWWRQQFWKGFYTCDIMMVIIHPIILVISAFVCLAILMPSTFRLYSVYPITKAWYILMILYTLCELGVSVYIYSFYGLAAWRLPFLIFCYMFYIIRFVLSVWFICIVYSYMKEVEEELEMKVMGTGSESTDYLYHPGGTMINRENSMLGGQHDKAFEANVDRYMNSAPAPNANDYYPHGNLEVEAAKRFDFQGPESSYA